MTAKKPENPFDPNRPRLDPMTKMAKDIQRLRQDMDDESFKVDRLWNWKREVEDYFTYVKYTVIFIFACFFVASVVKAWIIN